ncbi:hypothetical protein NQ176_g5349 [Zarea fungicola]|uniref:Uncharacterized protein n=1 Tax=Zarea fungicola TaxID=93591 RepID=A0ACC1N9Q6_9HYPO|nr:hypothetical protein NQ176_g5349 [Lecanicillium fungicola]
MQFSAFCSLIIIGIAATAIAAPRIDSTEHLTLAELEALPPFPTPSHHATEGVEPMSAKDLAERSSLKQNHVYRIGAWVFTIGKYLLESYSGVNGWVVPTDAISIDYLAGQIAESIRGNEGTGDLVENVGGGWTYFMTLAENYQFQNIPYTVLWGTITLAIQGANDWILHDNGLSFQTVDTNGNPIFTLDIFPTTRGQVTGIHDEF